VPTNLAVGDNAEAKQDVTNTSPNGTLRNTDVTRATNRAAGRNSTADQKALSAPSDSKR
jgi:hypothetical protein